MPLCAPPAEHFKTLSLLSKRSAPTFSEEEHRPSNPFGAVPEAFLIRFPY